MIAWRPSDPWSKSGVRPIRRLPVGLLLLTLVASARGPASAETAPGSAPPVAARPLPTVNYPFQLQNSTGRAAAAAGASSGDGVPSVSVPDAMYDDAGPPVYTWVGGVWGYWDRDRHFHPGQRAAAGSIRHPGEPARPFRGPYAMRPAVHLPNAGTGRIVTGQAAIGGRGRGN